MATRTKTITWTDRHEELARRVVERHADKMRMNDILPFTSATHDGQRRENQSGAILFALMLAAGEVPEREQ